MKQYLIFTIPTFGLLLISAILGAIYLNKHKSSGGIKMFVAFLWFTVLVEIIGSYTAIRHLTENEWFGFTLDSPFERNFWLYNAYFIISFVVYIHFFKLQLKLRRNRVIIEILLSLFIIASVLNLIFSGVYLIGFSSFTNIAGTLLILFTISLYYYQLLTSDAILEIKNSIIFYISLGAILLHIALTPLTIYSIFYNKEFGQSEFLDLFRIMIFTINVLVYLIYSAGFYICRNMKFS